MPVVTINPGAGATSFNLLATLNNWAQNLNYNDHGQLSPGPAGASYDYDQWAGGNTGGRGVIFDGQFKYGQGGNFEGSVNNLYFGTGLSGSPASNFSLASTQVHVNLGGGVPAASFAGAIYSLTHSANGTGNFTGLPSSVTPGTTLPGLFDFFGDSGTIQNGTAGADVLYSFDGNDVLNGGAGRDRFVFDRDIDGALSSTIGHDRVTGFSAGSNGDRIDLRGLESSAFDTFAEVYAAASQQGAHTVINLGSLGSITLEGVNKTALVAGNFQFAPATAVAEAA